jgi:hypothetical protein
MQMINMSLGPAIPLTKFAGVCIYDIWLTIVHILRVRNTQLSLAIVSICQLNIKSYPTGKLRVFFKWSKLTLPQTLYGER